ncbi:MAG: hypothetical protein WC408_02835 [Candidatus Micrarchaeia archaeon]|jgi:preprotein translocase subunit SecD
MASKVKWLRIAKNRRIQLVFACVLIAFALIWFKGLNTGIEFSGGVRIPITLDQSVDSATMDSIVETLKLRINKYGLSQSIVRPVGNNEILVEIPKASPEAIESVRNILKQQGRFEAIIDGQVAISGNDVLPGAVGGSNQESVIDSSTGKIWELGFAVSRDGGERFAKAGEGKGSYPVYMFLDRPQYAVIIARKATVMPNTSLGFVSDSITPALNDALKKQADQDVLVFAEDAANLTISSNYTTIVVEEGIEKEFPAVAAAIKARNTTVRRVTSVEMRPSYTALESVTSPLSVVVARWEAIGLISSPTLSPQLADGRVVQMFQVSGPGTGATAAEQQANAILSLRELKSVISGGKLPVSTSIGSSFSVAPSLGERFMQYSWLALIVGIIAVSLLIFIRYRHIELVLPIIIFNGIEVLLTTAIIGCLLGTLDLSAMAGIIVLMGSGVADQIVITEEMLRKGKADDEDDSHDEYEVKERIKKAFYVIFTVAGVVVAAMLPLILSGIVEIVGFGMSTVIGVLVGILITRPAYGDFMKEVFQKRA